MTRFFDIIFSTIALLVLSPVFLFTGIYIRLDSKGPVFYRQKRVARFGKSFFIYKLRSMYVDAEKNGPLLTIGEQDRRITQAGHFIRKYKLDELPQLINVLKGEMSIVGPRPEVKKYVELYTPEQQKILNVRPGITDVASVVYKNEGEILKAQLQPEQYYISHIMPDKIRLNQTFVNDPSLRNYFQIIWLTVKEILKTGTEADRHKEIRPSRSFKTPPIAASKNYMNKA